MTAPEPAPPPFDLEWMKGRLRFIESDCARHMLRDCFAEIERLRTELKTAQEDLVIEKALAEYPEG